MNGPLMSGFLNHKHACSSSFSSNLCAAAVSCLFVSQLFFPLLPSPTVSISVHPVSQIGVSTSGMANNLLSFNPVLSYSTPWFYPGPTAHRIADLPQSILVKILQGRKKPSEFILLIPLPVSKTVVLHPPRLMPKASFNRPSISTLQSCSSLINIQIHLLNLNTIYPSAAKTGSPRGSELFVLWPRFLQA